MWMSFSSQNRTQMIQGKSPRDINWITQTQSKVQVLNNLTPAWDKAIRYPEEASKTQNSFRGTKTIKTPSIKRLNQAQIKLKSTPSRNTRESRTLAKWINKILEASPSLIKSIKTITKRSLKSTRPIYELFRIRSRLLGSPDVRKSTWQGLFLRKSERTEAALLTRPSLFLLIRSSLEIEFQQFRCQKF